MELLLGCGSSTERRIAVGDRETWSRLVRVDLVASHRPDAVVDLDRTPWPFLDDTFDEIHAYEVLEHLGQQGDARSFFAHFGEAWRILKPGGVLAATCPSWRSMWAWGDPSHRRVITPGTLAFLDQTEYARQVGITAMSDFRWLWKGDFKPLWSQEAGDQFFFALEAVKPARLEAE